MFNTITGECKGSLKALLAALLVMNIGLAQTDKRNEQPSTGKKQAVVFKMPEGYMPMDFPQQKGVLMLDPKRPKGLFVVYPAEGQKADELLTLLKPQLVKMFIHEPKTELQWTERPLPAHKDVSDESGKLLMTSEGKMMVQIAGYIRGVGGREVIYGYFAMRSKPVSEKDKDGAEFVDESGEGVKDFEKFWKTIKPAK